MQPGEAQAPPSEPTTSRRAPGGIGTRLGNRDRERNPRRPLRAPATTVSASPPAPRSAAGSAPTFSAAAGTARVGLAPAHVVPQTVTGNVISSRSQHRHHDRPLRRGDQPVRHARRGHLGHQLAGAGSGCRATGRVASISTLPSTIHRATGPGWPAGSPCQQVVQTPGQRAATSVAWSDSLQEPPSRAMTPDSTPRTTAARCRRAARPCRTARRPARRPRTRRRPPTPGAGWMSGTKYFARGDARSAHRWTDRGQLELLGPASTPIRSGSSSG